MSNIAAEKLLLSGLIRYYDEFFQYCSYLDENHFSSDGSKITWLSLNQLRMNEGAENISKNKIISAAHSLGHVNYLSKVQNGNWLDEILQEKVSLEELKQNFLEVKRQFLIQNYIQATEDVRTYLRSTGDSLTDVISKVEDLVVGKVTLLDKGEHAIKPLTKNAKKFVSSLTRDPGNLGLDLGFPIWQSRVGQFRNGSVSFIVASTKVGKSMLGLRMGLNAAHKFNLPVLLLDSELNERDQLVRAIGQFTKIPYNIIETGYWKLSDKELLQEGFQQEEIAKIALYRKRLEDEHLWDVIQSLPIEYVSISGLSVQDVVPHIRRWLLTRVKPNKDSKIPQCLIIYDYIKLATIDEIKGGKIAEWQMHGLNVALLHDLVTRYNVPMVAFGQTNNEIDEGIRCVAGGKRISENVTSITYFKHKNDHEKALDSSGGHLARIFATRYGKGTPRNSYINFNIDLSCGDFKELNLGAVNFKASPRNDDDKE